MLFWDIIFLLLGLLSCHKNIVDQLHFFPLNVVFFSLTWSLCLSCTKGNIFYQTSWGSKAWWRKAWEPKSCDNIHPWWCTSNYWYESGQDIVSWIFAHSVSSTFMYFHFYIFNFQVGLPHTVFSGLCLNRAGRLHWHPYIVLQQWTY